MKSQETPGLIPISLTCKHAWRWLILLVLAWCIVWQAQARTLTWTGFDSDVWSDSGNWSPSFAPVDGDVLIFSGDTSVNDLTNLHVFSITFNGSSGGTLNGNPIFLDSAITASHAIGRARVNFDITFTTGGGTFYTLDEGILDIQQNVFLSGGGSLSLYPFYETKFGPTRGTNIVIHGIITGDGNLTKLGEGDVHLLGVWPNEYTGATTVRGGTLHLAKSGVQAISGPLSIGQDTTIDCGVIDYADGQYSPGLAVTVGAHGRWYLNYSTTVTNLTLISGDIIGTGILSLQSDVTVLQNAADESSFSRILCPLYLGNVTRTFRVESSDGEGIVQLTLSGSIIGPGPGINSPGIIKAGSGELIFSSDNSYFGPTVVNGGKLTVYENGSLGSSAGAEAGTTVNFGSLDLLGVTLDEAIDMEGGHIHFGGITTLNGSLVLSHITSYASFTGHGNSSLLQINGIISGPGSFWVRGATVRLAGSSPNTFGTGIPSVLVSPGFNYDYFTTNAVLELAKSGDAVAVPVPVRISGSGSDAGVLRSFQFGGVSDVTIYEGGAWLLNGNTASPNLLTFLGAGYVDTQGGTLYLGFGGTTGRVQVLHGYYTNGYAAQILGNVGLLQTTNDIFVTNGTTLNLNAVISSSGHLLKRGAGTLVLSGSAANVWDGDALVNEGTLELSKSPSTPAVLGQLLLGPATAVSPATARFQASGMMPAASIVTVNANSLLDLNGNDQTLALLNLNDGGDVATGAGTLSFTGLKTISVGTQNPSPPGLRASSFISGNLALPTFDDLVFNVAPYDPGYVSATPTLDVSANISGNGNLVMNGLGEMRLGGNNTFDATQTILAGEIYVNGGILFAASPTALGGTGGATYLYAGSMLVLQGGITINNEALHLDSINLPALDSRLGANTWNGPITMSRDSAFSANQPGDSLQILGVVSGTENFTKMGPGLVRLGGDNTYTGSTHISAGILQVDGVQPQSPVDLNVGTRLQGSGTVGHITLNGALTEIAPGTSPGILTCGNFNAGVTGSGSLQIELNGTTPGNGYDQVSAHGLVNLIGMSLNGSRSFSPAQEQDFTLINNDDTDVVVGTFTGLRQDTQVRIGNEAFHVNYAGGTGNDVVLTRRGRDITWTNTASGNWNVAANWSPNLVPGTNDTAFINRSVTVSLTNDVECYNLVLGDTSSPTLTGTGNLTLFVLNFEAGNLNGSGVVTVLHQMNWTGGTMTGSGRTLISSGAILSISGGSVTLSGGRVLENGGTTFWNSGNIQIASNSVITNRVGALFQVQSLAAITAGLNASRFDNAGTFRKTSASTTTINNLVSFNNYGTVEIQSGTLAVAGGGLNDGTMDVSMGTTLNFVAGTFNASAPSSITGAGNLIVSGATANLAGLVNVTGNHTFSAGTANLTGDYICTNNTVTINGTANFSGTGTVTPAVVNLGNNGNLSGNNTVTVLGAMTWTGGTMSGVGRTVVPAGVTLTINLGGTVTLSGGRILENGGTTLWNSGTIQAATATVITNRAGALFQVQSAAGIIPGAGGGRFDNAGTFRKTSMGTTTINNLVSFNNYGTVELQSGSLSLAGGGLNNGAMDIAAGTTVNLSGSTFTSSGGSSITGAGNFTVNGGTANLAGLVNVSGTNRFDAGSGNLTGNYICTNNTLVISGGTANFNGTGTVAPAAVSMDSGTLSGGQMVTVLSQMDWSGGTMTGIGRTVIPPGATLVINGNGTKTLSGGRILENGGTTYWNAGNVQAATATVITNLAGAVFQVQSAGGLAPGINGGRFDNVGTFRKTSAGTTTVSNLVSFNNYGTVEIQSGILAANGGYTSTASALLNCAIGGTTAGTGYGRLQVAGAVTLNGALGVTLTNGFVPTVNDSFTVLTAGTRNGAFANFHFPSNAVTMQMSNTVNSVIVRVTEVFVIPQPTLLQPELLGPDIRLTWTAVSNLTYRLEFNPDLNPSNWTALPGDVIGISNTASKLDALTGSNRLYRVRLIQ